MWMRSGDQVLCKWNYFNSLVWVHSLKTAFCFYEVALAFVNTQSVPLCIFSNVCKCQALWGSLQALRPTGKQSKVKWSLGSAWLSLASIGAKLLESDINLFLTHLKSVKLWGKKKLPHGSYHNRALKQHLVSKSIISWSSLFLSVKTIQRRKAFFGKLHFVKARCRREQAWA